MPMHAIPKCKTCILTYLVRQVQEGGNHVWAVLVVVTVIVMKIV